RLPVRMSSGDLKLVSSITINGIRYSAQATSKVPWMARRPGENQRGLVMALVPQFRIQVRHQDCQDRAEHQDGAGRAHAHLATAEGEGVHEHRRQVRGVTRATRR